MKTKTKTKSKLKTRAPSHDPTGVRTWCPACRAHVYIPCVACLVRAALTEKTTLIAVHHVNHDPQDNLLGNLEVFASNQAHKLYEARGAPAPIWRGYHLSTTPEKCGA